MKPTRTRTKIIAAIVVVCGLAFLSYSFIFKKVAPPVKETTKSDGFALIELFTSEGCSSCPSADALVARVVAEGQKNVYVLSYHVDYWNRLGWVDRFSQPAFSVRQKLYAQHLALDGVYTPQIVVNGALQFVGSNETRLRSAVKEAEAGKPSDLKIIATKAAGKVHIDYSFTGDAGLLNFAFVQPTAETQVKAGENGGHTLHHVNIVRSLQTVNTNGNQGSFELTLPNIADSPLLLIAFAQDKKTFAIKGVSEAKL